MTIKLLIVFAVLVMLPCNSTADLGDWVAEGIIWQKAEFGKDKKGELYIDSNYGTFVFNEEIQNWEHIEEFDWSSTIIPDENIKGYWLQSGSGFIITTEEGKFIVPHFGGNVSQFTIKLKSEDTNEYIYHLNEYIYNFLDEYTYNLSGLPEYEMVKKELGGELDLAIDVHCFDGKNIWFSLFHCGASYEGSDIGVVAGAFDIKEKKVNFIPLELLNVDIYPTITKIIADGEGIWIATGITSCYGVGEDAGIFYLDLYSKSCRRYNLENDSLPSNGIIDIIKGTNSIWVSTTKGIAKYDKIEEKWAYYQIVDAIAKKETKITCTPYSEWTIGVLHKDESVEPNGLAFMGNPTEYQYIVKLKEPIFGWTGDFPNEFYKQREIVSSESIFFNNGTPTLSFGYGMKYEVDIENSKNGLYEVAIDKGVVPSDTLKFRMGRLSSIEKKGTITSTGVSIYKEPTVDSEVINKVDRNDEVTILERSRYKERIDNIKMYWFRVKLKSGVIGWIFGHYIKPKENRN